MLEPPKKVQQVENPPDTRSLPPTFDPAYVEGAVKPFFLSSKYEGEPLLLPMIDLAFGKEAAVSAHLFGMLYNVMARLEATKGDSAVRSWFEKTMKDGPDESDKSSFTRLDRFVMELFRTIAPNAGSVSTLPAMQQPFGTGHPGFSTIVTPHAETGRDSLNWKNPNEFDPERYKQIPTSEKNDETKAMQIGLAQSPFSKEDFKVKDGRHASITNSVFGAVYGRVDDKAYPVCDTAGYSPFGFGYRRCPGEFLTVDFFKDLLRKVWSKNIDFFRLNIDHPDLLPVGPRTVVPDNIGFKRTR